MELIKRINSLIELANDEDLEHIKDSIYSISDYVNAITRMESGIKIARFRTNTQEDFVAEVERLDRGRRYKHNSAIVSTKILNRLCVSYGTDMVFLGDVEDRIEVAEFAKEVSDKYYEHRKK